MSDIEWYRQLYDLLGDPELNKGRGEILATIAHLERLGMSHVPIFNVRLPNKDSGIELSWGREAGWLQVRITGMYAIVRVNHWGVQMEYKYVHGHIWPEELNALCQLIERSP